MIHTIFMREHNRIAAALGNINPQWDDESIFQNCRAIVFGEFQAMVYEEFLPALFGRELFETLIGPFQGYDNTIDASIPAIFATAGFRFGHSLVRSEFGRLGANGRSLNIGPLPLSDAFLNPRLFHFSHCTDIATLTATRTLLLRTLRMFWTNWNKHKHAWLILQWSFLMIICYQCTIRLCMH